DVEYRLDARAGLQGAEGGALQHGSVGDRIGKRDAELQHVRAAVGEGPSERDRRVRRWGARRQKRDEGRAILAAGALERRPNPTQFPLTLSYSARSLSPRPERLTSTRAERGIPEASLIAKASAWALSRAGTMPSVRLRVSNASSASSSET